MDAGSGAPAPDLRQLSLAFVGGVLLVHAAPTLPPLAVLPILCLPALRRWPGRALWTAALFGVLLSVLQAQQRLDERWPPQRHGEEVELSGHIASLVEQAPGWSADDAPTRRFVFRPLESGYPRRIRVSWYDSAQRLRGGECWTLRLKLRSPHGSLNPGGFDYEGWLYRQGIGALATVRDAHPCALPAWMPVLRARQALEDRLQAWLGDRPGSAMVAALVVGDEAGFSDADWEVFRRTGTSHLVAISGFNVAILAGLAWWLLRWTWPLSQRLTRRLPAQKAGLIGAALAGGAYALFAGWESPAQRAALMLVLLILAALPSRRAQPGRVLAAAVLLMVAGDPAVVLAPGFWLSCGAVAAIFYVSANRLAPLPVWRAALHLQLMLSVVLAPLTLYFFQGVAWAGLLVNLVAVPVMAVVTPLVLAAVALGLLLPAWGLWPLRAVSALLGGMQDGLAWVAGHAPLAWWPDSPPAAALVLALGGALLLFAPRGWPLRPLGALCFLPLLWPPPAPLRGPLELTALDVGQGLAVLLRTPNHALLFDAGPAYAGGFDAGAAVVAPYVLRQGLRGVDRLLLSHGDRDHAGGVPAVRALLRVGDEIGTPGHPRCADGQHWRWDGVDFALLHPDTQDWSDNNRSCVLRVSAPGLSVLLTGDIERAAEARLLAMHPDALRADVLVAPHHGSKTSSTPAFVAAVAPRLVIFAAGWRSRYGHPPSEVVARYRALGAETRVTGVEGALQVWTAGPDGIRVQAWRRRGSRFWNAPATP